MNTNQLKKFAQAARTKLIEQVGAKLDFVLTHDTAELRGKANTLKKLNEAISKNGKANVIDKVAYTWFNRLVALRYMDANGYQPLGMSVITPANTTNSVSPELLDAAHGGSIPSDLNVDRKQILDLLDGRISSSNPDNEVFRKLLVAVCNQLHGIFPFLFERIDDYTELLLPDDLTSPFSIIKDVVDGMTSKDCAEVEIIGWLYQFYISEKKDEVFASKSAVKKEDIPAATQLFTPRWIVEYMVQNTVGKLWLQNKPGSKLKDHMPYFIDSPSLHSGDFLKVNSVEEIKLLDQACGSGHILVYGFDLFYRIYEEEGYNPNEIPELIIKNNLHGFEIDERAAQLAGFAIMMKARSYYRRFFRSPIETNILCYEDLALSAEEIKETFTQVGYKLSDELNYDLLTMQQATNFGSLIAPHTSITELQKVLEVFKSRQNTGDAFLQFRLIELIKAIKQLIPLSIKYHCIVDNPPYMGSRKMDVNFKKWIKLNYSESYQDLFTCFIVRAKLQLCQSGLASFITLQGWMFVSTFEYFRKWILKNIKINSLVQIGGNSFPSLNSQVARAVVFCFENIPNKNSKTKSFDLDSIPNTHSIDKKILFEKYISESKFNERNFQIFEKVNRTTFLHSVSDELLKLFLESISFEEIADAKQGLATGNNDEFIRFWHEISNDDYKKDSLTKEELWKTNAKWVPYNKGGDYRKWYGNNDNVIKFSKIDFEKLSKQGNHLPSKQFYFKKGITYSLIGNSDFCARSYDVGSVFDVGGSAFFTIEKYENYLLGLVNSQIGSYLLSKLNPTVNFQVGDINCIPIFYDEKSNDEISDIVKTNITISKNEWSIHEENPDFDKNEIFLNSELQDIVEIIDFVIQKRKVALNKLFSNENLIDHKFAELYNIEKNILQKSKKISLFNNLKIEEHIDSDEKIENEWVRQILNDLISFSVGCMFGRYSLDKEGLILANQSETLKDYLVKVSKGKEQLTFVPDEDNVIPVLYDEWFEDDIVARFHAFLKVSFGEAQFQKNLAFVEECLGKDIRKYFVKDFYKDHIKRYKKRPIYWMFSSPKGYFNVLIYMHRYTPDTLNTILNGYLREFIGKLELHRKQQEHIVVNGSPSEQNKAQKEIDKIDDMLADCRKYESEILYPLAGERISIDLDDGVLVNYNKFGTAITAVDGLNDKKTKKKVMEFDWIDTTLIR
jgi:hypothetical protein